MSFEEYLTEKLGVSITHGIHPDAAKELRRDSTGVVRVNQAVFRGGRMKMQRLAVLLLALNLVLLACSVTQARSTAAQATDSILRVRTLELVDDRGQVRSRLNVESGGEVVFRLFDQTGTIRVKLGAGESGSGLVLNDETTEPGVHILARRAPIPGRKTTSITLTGADARERVITP